MARNYFRLSTGNFFEDWTDIGRLSVANDWSLIANINGFRGDNLTTIVGRDPQLVLTDSPDNQLSVLVNQTNPNTNATGGVAEFELTNPTIALQGSSTGDAPNLVLYLDATGRQNVVVSFNVRDIDGSTDNALQQIAVQYRTSPTGAWVNVPSGFLSDGSTGPSLATFVNVVTATLPADAANAAALEVRIITVNAIGNDEWLGIDDISVTSNEIVGFAPGVFSVNDASVVEGGTFSSGEVTVTVNRTGGSTGAANVNWDIVFPGVANAANSADLATGALQSGTVNFADGQTSATFTISLRGDDVSEPNEVLTVQLSAPTGGATLAADADATITITNDDFPPPANVFINEIHYDNSGASDVGEAIEVAGFAGVDLTGWSLVLYNGNGGASYGTIALSGVISNQSNGFGTVSVLAPGLQNGAPDGIALVDNYGRVIQFLSYEGVMTATSGPANGLTSTAISVSEEPAPAAGLSLQLVGTGSSAADFIWVAAADDNFGTINNGQSFLSGSALGQISVSDASIVEGDTDASFMTFTVTRAGGFDTVATVDYDLFFNGDADSTDLGDDFATSGTITFGIGETQQTFRILIDGDTVGEPNETFEIILSNVTGNAVIADGLAIGTIINNDPVTLTISEIQGEGHTSTYAGQPVVINGIVTAVDTNGFYIQSETGDENARTSDGIFVFTSTAPTVAVGDRVVVNGTVTEFVGGTGALSLTQITAPTVTILTSGNVLPTAIVIGAGGLTPPSGFIDDDGMTSYDPLTDGIDFWESLEGMRVTIDAPIVVSNTTSFGETDVVASGGVGASGINDRGGITIAPGDFNPEKIQIDDDSGIFAGYTPGYSIGDRLSSVTGIVNYSFNNYEVLVTEAVTLTTDVTLAREVTSLVGDNNYVTIATYNVENLDPTDLKFDLVASDIVYSLRAPDIIGLQEIQDADGAGTGTNLSGTVTAQLLIDAILAAGGPRYTYVEVAPTVTNTTGGEPNGNIRPGFLYNADRVSLVEGSLTQIASPAFNNSRSPLVASFEFNGQVITTVNVHFTSRGGSETLWGANQPPAAAGEASRTAQAAAVQAFINDHLATNPDYELALLGDFNGFYFEQAQLQLTGGTGVLTNLAELLLPPEERYSYIFEGNSQLIDNILVTGGLLDRAEIDGVHINAQFGTVGRATDHDPQVVRIFVSSGNFFGTAGGETLTGTPNVDNLYGLGGNDILIGDASADYLSAGEGDDELRGEGGNDILIGWLGDDSYYISGDDLVVEYADGGDDTVYVISNFVLGSSTYVESIIIGPGTNAVNITTNGFGVFVDGNDGVNIVIGGAGDDYFFGNGGADDLYGLGGADSLVGDDGDDYLSGGDGNDSLAGRAGADTLLGGSGDDSYVADLSDLVVEYAGGGVDSLTIATSYALGAGNEIEFVSTDDSDGTDAINFTGNEIGNTLTGNAGVNSLYGLDGNDNLIGGGGNDYLSGGDGDDQLTGGTGADTLLGGLGDDTYFAEESDLVVEYAGGGIDAIFASSNFVLAAGNEIEFLAATGFGGTENMNLSGNEFNNAITGNEGNNRLFGGMGEDTLTGNGGADVFEFGGAIGLGHVDTITDFVSIDDLMLLDSRVFTGMTAGLLNADAFLSGAGVTAATNAAHRIIHDTTTGKLYFDADGDGAGAAVEFAIIGADTPVFSTDFYVF
jgi:uncharacterized protein